MHLLPLLALVSVALATPLTPQQLAFQSPSFSSLLPSNLPTSISSSLLSRLSTLPSTHLEQLQSHINEWTEPRLVQLRATDGQAGETLNLSEGQKSLLTFAGIRYIDITNYSPSSETSSPSITSSPYPSHLSHNSTSLSPLLESISLPSISTFLKRFTSFHTRYYRSQSGRDSQLFLLEHLKEIHSSSSSKKKNHKFSNVTFTEFDHEWVQKSIIVRWEPVIKSANYSGEVVILSAHQDSTNSLPFLPAPGADDDASGTVTLIETFTQLVNHGLVPRTNPIEFHFYSAEEGGLLGSGEIAKKYRDEGKKVKGMFHMDVVAYIKPGTEPVIGMITDGTDRDLVEFMKLVVDEYATIPYAETQCGYGCSDFASFTKNGYRSTCLAEGKFADSNPNMHSMGDTMEAKGYSLEHIREFVRVAIGYAVELGGMEKSSKRDGRWRME